MGAGIGRFRLKPGFATQRQAMQTLVIAFVLVAALLYLVPAGVERESPDQGVVLDAIPVEVAPSRISLHASGVARPAAEIPLLAEVSGRVLSVDDSFVSGAVVASGHALATIDPEPYELALARRRNEVSAAALHLAETRARASVAERTSGKRATDYARMVPHLAEARTRLEAAEAARRSAELELARTRVTAPFRGRLRDVRVQAGQYVKAGDLLGYLYTPEAMEVRLPVRDDVLALIDLPADGARPEQPVPVTLSADFGGVRRQWQGELLRREGGLDGNQMVTLVTRVETGEDQVPLEPGVWLDARIQGARLPSVASLPESVVGHDGGVWLVDERGRLSRRAVSVLYRDDDRVYVGAGLAGGDRVVLAGNLRLMEGAEVQVRLAAVPAVETPAPEVVAR